MDDADLPVLAQLLDSLNVAMCLFDADERQQLWNRSFLRFFPEHEGHIHPGEPYRENLRRFFEARLPPEELPSIEQRIQASLKRNREQLRPYTFQHRDIWMRVAGLPLATGRRLRLWTQIPPPALGDPSVLDGPARNHPRDNIALFDNVADGVMVMGADDRIVSVNESFVLLYTLPHKDAAIGRRFADLVRALWEGAAGDPRRDDVLARVLPALVEHLRFSGAPFELPLPGERWVRLLEHRSRDGIGYCLHADITLLKRQQRWLEAAEAKARESEARYRLLAENSSDAILSLDDDLVLRYASPAATELLGLVPPALVGRTLAELVHEDDRAAFIARHFTRRAREDERADMMFRVLHPQREAVWVEARVRPLAAAGSGTGYVCNLRDASQRKRAEDALAAANAELATLASTDALTGLANRRQFDATLNKEWFRALRDGDALALLMIDVDHFKALNDSFGHQVGDAFLAQVARLLTGCVKRAGDLAARYGGEEFAILLPGTDGLGAHEIAEAVRHAVAAHDFGHLVAGGHPVTVSIGLAHTVPSAGRGPATLVHSADAALYQAKHGGRNRVVGLD